MSSRVAKKPIILPKGVEVSVTGSEVTVKGKHGTLKSSVNPNITLVVDAGQLFVKHNTDSANKKVSPQFVESIAGTTRAIVNNMVQGVNENFTKKLILKGVGYKASASGNKLTLNLGFSHIVEYSIPEGLTITTPTQTEIIITGQDKCLVGQSASDIRSYRSPEPYKGKGIRYDNENVQIKETKK